MRCQVSSPVVLNSIFWTPGHNHLSFLAGPILVSFDDLLRVVPCAVLTQPTHAPEFCLKHWRVHSLYPQVLHTKPLDSWEPGQSRNYPSGSFRATSAALQVLAPGLRLAWFTQAALESSAGAMAGGHSGHYPIHLILGLVHLTEQFNGLEICSTALSDLRFGTLQP